MPSSARRSSKFEFFKTRVEAETMLGRVLVDEPDWRDVLHVEPIELVTGGEN
jgi:hypothetical protein